MTKRQVARAENHVSSFLPWLGCDVPGLSTDAVTSRKPERESFPLSSTSEVIMCRNQLIQQRDLATKKLQSSHENSFGVAPFSGPPRSAKACVSTARGPQNMGVSKTLAPVYVVDNWAVNVAMISRDVFTLCL